MIEDALGLKVFQFKKAESERKLKKTRENIAQVESLRREVAPHLRFLEKQIKKVEKSIALQEELKTVYADYLKREDTYIAFHHDRLTEARREPEKRREELKKTLETAKEKLKTGGEDDTRDELVLLEESMRTARGERQESTRKIGQLEGQILFLERQVALREKKRESEADAPIPRSEFKKIVENAEKVASKADSSDDAKVLARIIQDIVSSLRVLLTHAFTGSEEKEAKTEKQELDDLKKTKANAERDITEIEKREEKLSHEYAELKKKIESEGALSREAEREVFTLMNEEREVEQKIDAIDRELAQIARDRDEFKNELQEAVSLLGRASSMYFEYIVKDAEGKALSKEELIGEERTVQQNRRRELERMKIRLEELGTGSNEDVLREYQEVKERDEFLVREVTDLTESVAKLESLIEELTRDLNEQFVTGIEKISTEFGKFFTLMFGGGSTELIRVKPKVKEKDELEMEEGTEASESEEPEEAEEGIEIDVKLPNKRVRGLDMLSGGERALTSIALIFAMSQVNPPLIAKIDRKSTRLNSSHPSRSRMPSSA
jgi:chromosome segregation protein